MAEETHSNPRLSEITNLLSKQYSNTRNTIGMDDGAFNATAMLITDAILTGDDESLVEADRWLRQIHGLYLHLGLDRRSHIEERGQVLGLILIISCALQRIIPRSVLAELKPAGSYQRRVLKELASSRQGRTKDELARASNVFPERAEEILLQFGEQGFAVSRRLGGSEDWEITPRGREALKLADRS